MLPKRYRLDRPALAAFFSKKTKSLRGRFVMLRALPNTARYPRFACIVSSSFARGATLRNKGRRRMYAVAHSLQKDIKKNTDIVFFLKLTSRTVPSLPLLQDDMIHVLKTWGLL